MRSFRKVFLFLMIGLFVACGDKENKLNFEQMSENEKISYLNAKIKKEPKNADLLFKRAEIRFNKKEFTENTESIIVQVKYLEGKIKTIYNIIVRYF